MKKNFFLILTCFLFFTSCSKNNLDQIDFSKCNEELIFNGYIFDPMAYNPSCVNYNMWIDGQWKIYNSTVYEYTYDGDKVISYKAVIKNDDGSYSRKLIEKEYKDNRLSQLREYGLNEKDEKIILSNRIEYIYSAKSMIKNIYYHDDAPATSYKFFLNKKGLPIKIEQSIVADGGKMQKGIRADIFYDDKDEISKVEQTSLFDEHPITNTVEFRRVDKVLSVNEGQIQNYITFDENQKVLQVKSVHPGFETDNSEENFTYDESGRIKEIEMFQFSKDKVHQDFDSKFEIIY